ncbi:Phytanoyl-CoA dioxygenase (PhyH) [Hymenobacter gelipurpurascens]|uniref:Phytanoyl-CoA dioxygenase (PhyH) n=1 Tax=Hymenobacter gelipurpurascens TaxID=89968 RepID=A0A212UG44_9BACT|nr:phytanoyl-CoA dioxygenase family protein [Hymenobacter gelipurpurascens]SNC77217.1 Phytanoyl-CoA dioxygenase (PhyH) [Hymenobacter gelipurpurascens]
MLQRLLGHLRAFKPAYMAYNFLHRRRLRHNEALYRRYGLRQPIYSSISSADFREAAPGESPRFDRADSARLAPTLPGFAEFDEATQQQILQWSEKGYLVLRGLFTAAEVATINAEVAQLIDKGEADWNARQVKIMFAIRQSEAIRRIVAKRELERVLDFLLGKKAHVFQSINFLRGSEQLAHSDSIHMTTYPLGYLVAAWIALEPVTAENGPVFYYPGSHRLPYVLNGDFPHGGSHFLIGDQAYQHYEQAIEAVIARENTPAEELHAQPGDVLIWHANLLHGGRPIRRAGSTRRSMVLHYFAQDDVVCYHEITQRPALL